MAVSGTAVRSATEGLTRTVSTGMLRLQGTLREIGPAAKRYVGGDGGCYESGSMSYLGALAIAWPRSNGHSVQMRQSRDPGCRSSRVGSKIERMGNVA